MDKRLRRMGAWLVILCMAACLQPAMAEEVLVRTPDMVRERMNGILAYENSDRMDPFADMVDFDDAGGFDFCAMDGERMLHLGEANAFIRGRVDEDGRMDELVLIMQPSGSFGRGYGVQADILSRVCMFSLFDALTEAELDLLMNSYLYDIRPYRYSEGDRAVAQRTRMCEIELRDEVVRIDSEAADGNALRMSISFLYDADDATRERAQENGWRIRRLSQAASECEMIQTCGDCLCAIEEADFAENLADIDALLELSLQSAGAIGQMQTEHMHAQEVFLQDLQELCAQLVSWVGDYRAACDADDLATAWLRMQDICRISSEIGRLPETLY